MKEKECIEIIKSIFGTRFIGDDCAYLEELGIVVTQDSLVEGVHFDMRTTTPYKLGYKTVMVNVSDVCASGAEPKYLTVAVSGVIDTLEFARGVKAAADKCGVQIVGGDITGADKIFISAAAIGTTAGRNIASRANARPGYKIIVSGEHGNSAAGFLGRPEFLDAHLMPEARVEFSRRLATQINVPYAMMDTSDGLADALWQIARASSVLMEVEYEKIPRPEGIDSDLPLFGGEDYQLVACVPEEFSHLGTIIGEVKEGAPRVLLDGKELEQKFYDHFA